MKTPRVVIAMGEIGDDLVSSSLQYKPKMYPYHPYIKRCVVIGVASMALFLGNIWFNYELGQYMIENHIKVIYEDTNSDSICGADVTPEQAESIKAANEIHNMFSAYNFEWYGNSYYDFETGSIKVGITDFSTDHQNTVKELVGEIKVDIFQCEYSYEYLEEIYNKIDNRSSFFKLLGVEGYYISVIDNCVTVRISDADNHIAIYAVNELTNGKGGVVFKTTSYITDLQS